MSISLITESSGSLFAGPEVSEQRSRLSAFERELKSKLAGPSAVAGLGGADVDAVVTLMEEAFRAGFRSARENIQFDPDDRAPDLPLLSHDVHSRADGALMRLRQQFFGKTNAYLPDVMPARLHMATDHPRSVLLKRLDVARDATKWHHSHDEEAKRSYSDEELEPLISARLLRVVHDSDGNELLLVTRWGFEFLATGRTLGVRDPKNIYHRVYDQLTEVLDMRRTMSMRREARVSVSEMVGLSA
jgi:hypothetical protein